jgi:hypothetical protein
MRTLLACLLAASLLLAGCGDDDDTEAGADSSTSTTVADEGTTTTTAAPTTTAGTTPGELPGERIELFPYEGTVLAVVGVAADDQLNLRAAPDPGAAVVAELDPLAGGIAPSGHNRQVDDGSIWAEVTADGTSGWANIAFLAHLADAQDITAQQYPDVADRPRAETLVQLVDQVVAQRYQSGEPEPEVVVVDGPTVGDLGEITVDVVGLGDDAALGERLHLFAEEEGSDSFRLRTIEATTLCRRGVSDGRCV